MDLVEQKVLVEHLLGVRDDALEAVLPEPVQETIVSRLRRGDRSAAHDLVDQYYARIFLYLRELGHNRHMSEDLTQEAFLRAWNHLGQLKDEKALNAWLYRIASNVSCEYWRKHKRRENATRQKMALQTESQGESESSRAGANEQLELLQEAIVSLSWKLRQAVVLHYVQQFTIADSAKVAGVKDGTFKSRLNRALEILRKEMK
jgi:RNA polymerase sigma-70 factor (ECF subfamily)